MKLTCSVIPKLMSAVSLTILLSGCAGLPSVSDAQKQLDNRITTESKGCIKLVSFEKTNGLERGEIYTMEYSAEIEFLCDCIWEGHWGHYDDFSVIKSGDPHENLDRKGDRKKIKGSLTFEKTERGWRPSGQ